MAFNGADSVKVEWEGTGPLTMTLGAAVAGFQAVPASFHTKTISYTIEHKVEGVVERENGEGVYDNDAKTLTRASVKFSTNGGSLVDFSPGMKHVSLVLLAHNIAAIESDIATLPIIGSRQAWGEVELDASSGNVTFDGGSDPLIVRVQGHTVARNLSVTPAPTQSARTLIVANEGTANATFLDHGSSSIAVISAGSIQVFHWESGAWAAGLIFGAGGGGGSLSITKQVLTVGDGATLAAALHAKYQVSGSTLLITRVRLRHASNQASSVTVTVEDGLSDTEIEVHQAEDQTGTCTLQRETSATINGVTSVPLTGAGSSALLIATATNVYRLKGDVDLPIDVDGQIIEGNRARVLTSVTGSLTKETHSGRVLVLSGNVTVPNGANDDGFNALLIATGAQTVTFNSLTSPAMAAGDMMSVMVQSTTVIKAALVAAADQISFT